MKTQIIDALSAIDIMKKITNKEICGVCLDETYEIDSSKYYDEIIEDYKPCKRIICDCGETDIWINEELEEVNP